MSTQTDITLLPGYETNIKKYTCDICGETIEEESVVYMDDKSMCADCADERLVVCDRCGERVWRDDTISDSNYMLCTSCYDQYFVSCDFCHSIVNLSDCYYLEDDSDTPYCEHCYEEKMKSKKVIHPYGYKPEPIFYGSGLFMGVELEIDNGGEDSYYAEKLLDIGNAESEYLYIKRDSSLDNGLELVTHPLSLEYHRTKMNWRGILEEAIRFGYRSHKAGTCGLHVHVGRLYFGETVVEQEAVIARILFFIEAFWKEILKFSRRTEQQMNRWACRYGLKDSPQEVMNAAKSSDLGRYTAVNLCNFNTIEFRMMRGTLIYQTLIASLQLIQLICDLALTMTDDAFRSMSWQEFVMKIDAEQMPELIEYLKLRMLYVNEQITELEEI